MELRHLETFAAAAELQSFTRAGEALAMTQPAVSQHVAALEVELRVALFKRCGRRVIPTEAGRRLYGYVCRIVDLLEEARREVGRVTTTVSGTLRIAACTIPPESLLPELIAEFRQAYPEIAESVTVSDCTEAARAVAAGAADLGIIGELPHGTRLRAQPIGSDELVLVAPPEHSLAKLPQVTAAQLRDQAFILREPGSGSRHCLEEALEKAGICPETLPVALEMNSNEAIRAAVERGLGVAFLSQAAVRHELAEGRLVAVPVVDMQLRRQLYLITDPSRIPTPAARAFLTFVERRQNHAGASPAAP